MTPREEALRDAIIAISDALDPYHEGECWPDPIAWFGEVPETHARALLILADAAPDDERSHDAGRLGRVRDAAEALREVLV